MDLLADTKKRRSKKDLEGRLYTCECGKSYLSYQALYTHKRVKHTEVIIQEDIPKKKRGRPKGIKSVTNDYDFSSPLADSPLCQRMKAFLEGVKQNSCDDAFVEFLLDRAKILSRKEYLSLAMSVLNLRDCINKNYKEIDDKPILDTEEYSAVRDPRSVPKISNAYILDFLPIHNPEHDKNAEIDFVLEFCNWLIDKNYTELEVSIRP